MQILIVDDDRITLQNLKRVLTAEGHEVLMAENGREALATIRKSGCRLVVSDWEMPEMDGLRLCEAIRSGDFPGYIYFILLTCHNAPEEAVRGLTAGADDFITKPFNAAELVVRIRTGERILALETRDVAIFSMAKLAESRHPETGAHLERVRGYCRIIARHLLDHGLFSDIINESFVRLIYATSPLHDIGKIGIPDCVLLKPDHLTDHEFEIMKTHTSIGADTLEAALEHFPNAEFLRMARDIAATHHERFDGKGYPAGLSGEAIPLAGRITALADVYDALISTRSYKESFDHDVAKTIILQESGTHFDPRIVEAFLANEGQFMALTRKYSRERA